MREPRDQQYTSSQTLERLLNEAIIHADIRKGFEEYIEIFDAFYADDIEVSSDVIEEPVRGKSRVTSLLFNFQVPLHVMAEVAGLSVSIREIPLPADANQASFLYPTASGPRWWHRWSRAVGKIRRPRIESVR